VTEFHTIVIGNGTKNLFGKLSVYGELIVVVE